MRRPFPRSWPVLMALGLGVLALGCGGSVSSPTPAPQAAAPPANGILNVYLTSNGLAPTFGQMNLLLSGMSVEVGGTWTKVPLDALQAAPAGGTPGGSSDGSTDGSTDGSSDGTSTGTSAPPASQSVDLLSLSSAAPATLATSVPWPGGPNTGVRLVLASGATVQLAEDGSSHPLEVQTVLDASMGLPGGFSVVPGFATNLWLVVDVANAALPDPNDVTSYVFAPLAVRAYDKAATGSIKGQLTAAQASNAGAPAPLAGATVTAQLAEPLAAAGAGVVFRTAVTDASGMYTLDLLPLDWAWCVVSQPTAGTTVYAAAAGAGAELGQAPYNADQGLAPFNADTSNVVCSPATATGAVSGTLTWAPAAGEVDVVDLVQSLGTGAAPCDATVQSALVAAGAFSFPVVPAGTYRAVLNRYTWTSGAGPTNQPAVTNPFVLAAGAPMAIQF